jgi:SepF-like predicted cell division protein (DUF552 family)
MIETRQRTRILERDEQGNVLTADIANIRRETSASRRVSREVAEHQRSIRARNEAAFRAQWGTDDVFATLGEVSL